MAKTLKLDTELWRRISACSEKAGYSSPEEFVVHILEQTVAKLEEAGSDEDILNKLKGLGYIE